ncbi:hypothetical protein [Thermodesulfitimonas autotrophica]|uniref:hypothetical protein n=1 Tax=Thermodesulfitimonas autotrophica TaxID=1894989 RepID=UPI002FE29BA2
MSCAALRHRFEEERARGLTFERALAFYTDVEGSVSAHRVELEELRRKNASPEEIRHLEEHIAAGERLLSEIKGLRLH